METGQVIARIDDMIDGLAERYAKNSELVMSLKEIKAVINSLEEA